MRTPLTAVVGISSWMMEEDLDPRYREQLGVMCAASQALLAQINDVLDLARAEAGALELSYAALDLEALGREACGMLHVRAKDKGLHLLHSHQGERLVLGDGERLRQIALNLLGNAVKFTESGQVELRTVCRRRAGEGLLDVTLSVSDTGVGIPMEQQEGVFERFVGTEHTEGAGLGLSIVRSLVDLMGGQLEVVSTPGEGSTFIVRLALVQVEPQPEKLSPSPSPARGRLRVLVADDNVTNLAVFEIMLGQLECDIETAQDGREAVAKFEGGEADYDVVFMDCRMPVLSGQEASRQLRAMGVTIPIVALTADATPEVRAECLDAGMSDFVTKPITQGALRELVERLRGEV